MCKNLKCGKGAWTALRYNPIDLVSVIADCSACFAKLKNSLLSTATL